MAKKKQILYGFVFVLLAVISVFCFDSIKELSKNASIQRINYTKQSIKHKLNSNIEIVTKDLLLIVHSLSLDSQKDIPSLIEKIKKIPENNGSYYIVDNKGIFHSGTGSTSIEPIDYHTLDTAYLNGYFVLSVSEEKSSQKNICLLLPISKTSPYFLAKIFKPTQYFKNFIIEDIPTSAKDSAFIFDELGNLVFSFKEESIDVADENLLLDNAMSFYLNKSVSIYPTAKTGYYNTYIPLDAPDSWFVGMPINDNTQSIPVFSYYLPVLAVMVSLMIVFAAVVVIDIINDHDHKKKQLTSSTIDQLTGLLNIEGMFQSVKNFSKKHPMTNYQFVCMDISNFGRINTMFGFSFGDSLLCSVAHIISQEQYCCTRINADSFAFLTKQTEENFEKLQQKLYDFIALHLGDEYLQMIVFKFGVYPIGEAQPIFAKIYDGARLALTIAKKQNRNTTIIYDEILKKNLDLQKNIEVNMMHALSKNEFEFYVQPQFTMPDETCERGEALIRWNSETMGFLYPDKFIDIFEKNGFIVETDFYMLNTALDFLQKRQDKGQTLITLAINQSKVTISFPNYFERLKETILSYSVPLEYIELEITESTLDADWDTIIPLINNIKNLGFTISMDDFGSGFSSLNTLRMLPIDVLKIDRMFLHESDNSERSKTIIKNIVNLAKNLSIEVVCEGVETQAQLDFLKNIKCDIIQGYYYSQPIPLNDFITKFIK